MRPWYREPMLAAAASAFGVATIVMLFTLYRAIAGDARAESRPLATGPASVTTIVLAELPDGLMEETVDHDPFHPERRRPAVPFRLPGEKGPAAAVVAPPPNPAATLQLLGTVVTPGQDAFVLCQLGNEPPHVVRAGGKIGGYTLRRIEPGRAVFLSPDGGTVNVRVSKPGS
jgi:hypothetical protein